MVYYWAIVKNEWKMNEKKKMGLGGEFQAGPWTPRIHSLWSVDGGQSKAGRRQTKLRGARSAGCLAQPLGGWRYFDFMFHRALSLTGPAMNGPVKPSQSWSNQIKPNQARKRFDPNEVNPKRCAYVRLKFDLPVAKEAGRKQPNQTQSNQIKPPAGGDGSGQWPVASASGWWRKRVGENCPVKPSQTQSNPV